MKIENQKNFLIVGLSMLGLVFATNANAFTVVPMAVQKSNDVSVDLRNSPSVAGARSVASGSKLSQLRFKKDQYNLKILNEETDKSGKQHIRYIQTYNGIPIWGRNVIQHKKSKSRSGGTRSLNSSNPATFASEKFTGQLVTDLNKDLMNAKPTAGFTEDAALELAKNIYIKENKINLNNLDQLYYENEKSSLVVYTHGSDGKAKLAYSVSFFVDDINGNNPARPSYIIDASTKQIIKNWNSLMHNKVGTGPGGNEKTGKHFYNGKDMDKLDVREAPRGECFMTNSKARTVDLKNGYHGAKTYHYRCYENSSDAINGAYSPINDAHYFGEKIFNMYREWYDRAPLNFKLLMRVHYGTSYENAFWNGSSMTFGDGRDSFYPLVSMDVAAHEVSHGFTEQNSNLEYMDQSGGINEAFSDMAGKAAEFYVFGKNTWGIGDDITKNNEPLRYLNNPEKDGVSIGDARDYKSWLDVHYSSGVFNKAFYLLSTHDNWNIKKAFDVFVHANIYYWTSTSDFTDAALGAVYSAEDLGFDSKDVVEIFKQVGIGCDDDVCNILPDDRVTTKPKPKDEPKDEPKDDPKDEPKDEPKDDPKDEPMEDIK